MNIKGEVREGKKMNKFWEVTDFGSNCMNLYRVESYQKKGGGYFCCMLIKNIFYVFSNHFLLNYLRGLLK